MNGAPRQSKFTSQGKQHTGYGSRNYQTVPLGGERTYEKNADGAFGFGDLDMPNTNYIIAIVAGLALIGIYYYTRQA